METNWRHEAAEWMSGGFTKAETIEKLVEEGCPKEEAESHVNALLQKSQKKGWGELGLGLVIMLVGTILPASRLRFFALIGGLVLMGDGIRRLGSLALVSKASIFPKFSSKK